MGVVHICHQYIVRNVVIYFTLKMYVQLQLLIDYFHAQTFRYVPQYRCVKMCMHRLVSFGDFVHSFSFPISKT